MTTYILQGGNTTKDTPDNELFFKYFTHFVQKDEVRILMCYFAKPKDMWETRLETDRAKIERQTTKKVFLSIANDPKDLLKKMGSYDVLYVAGGDPQPLESYLPLLKSLKEKLDGKVYMGCSMGAFIVSSRYVLSFEKEVTGVHHGLGLLPISTLCHFNVEEKKELKVGLLKKDAPESPILVLDECKFCVFIR